MKTDLKITFITNYMTHHQLPFCKEMYKILGDNFAFLQTTAMEEERKNMGFLMDVKNLGFVYDYDSDYSFSENLLDSSDVVICGGTHESYIKPRLDKGKVTFRYFERLYKDSQWKAFIPTSYMRNYKAHTKRNNSPVFLLCAGAYVPTDFSLLGAYKDKMFKWGYFTEMSPESFEDIYSKRKDNEIVKILWVGRMLDWKHPEVAVLAINNIINNSHKKQKSISLTMIGEGPEKENLLRLIKEYKLEEYIQLLDFLDNESIRKKMEESDIYLMTSDGNEGWGAVVNEAMDKGMAVIGSSHAGSVPYLIQNGENGYIYKNLDIAELSKKIELLISDKALRYKLGENAYNTIHNIWNAKVAAERIVDLSKLICDKGNIFYENNGPLSKALNIPLSKGYQYFTK